MNGGDTGPAGDGGGDRRSPPSSSSPPKKNPSSGSTEQRPHSTSGEDHRRRRSLHPSSSSTSTPPSSSSNNPAARSSSRARAPSLHENVSSAAFDASDAFDAEGGGGGGVGGGGNESRVVRHAGTSMTPHPTVATLPASARAAIPPSFSASPTASLMMAEAMSTRGSGGGGGGGNHGGNRDHDDRHGGAGRTPEGGRHHERQTDAPDTRASSSSARASASSVPSSLSIPAAATALRSPSDVTSSFSPATAAGGGHHNHHLQRQRPNQQQQHRSTTSGIGGGGGGIGGGGASPSAATVSGAYHRSIEGTTSGGRGGDNDHAASGRVIRSSPREDPRLRHRVAHAGGVAGASPSPGGVGGGGGGRLFSPPLHPTPSSGHHRHASPSPARTAATMTTPSSANGSFRHNHDASLVDTMVTLCTSTAERLEHVWDEVGYAPDERSQQLAELLNNLSAACEQKVQEELAVADAFRKSIHDARVELAEGGRLMDFDVDPALIEPSSSLAGGPNLTEVLSGLDTALESLREARGRASAELTACRDELVSLHDALGEEVDARWLDVESDLTAENLARFRAKVDETRGAVSRRTGEVVRLLIDCRTLMRELRIGEEGGGEDSEAESLSALDRQILGSLIEHDDDGEEGGDGPGSGGKKERRVSLASTRASETCTGIGADVAEALAARLTELNGEKRRRKVQLGEMGDEISSLWEMLRVPAEEQREFSMSVRGLGLGLDTIGRGRDELRRLRSLKGERMGVLVEDARDAVRRLWDELGAGPEERGGFSGAMGVTDESLFTDELLAEHDAYVRHLESKLERVRPILKIIERREEILVERMKYEEFQQDPDRLQQRGSALTRQLMMEEKMGKRIRKDLPKMTDLLERKLREWREDEDNSDGREFSYRGEAYVDTMRRQEEEWRRYKDDKAHQTLIKKQEERASENFARSGGTTSFKPLPGKKRDKWSSASNSSHPPRVGPLSNAQSRDNRMRSVSRGKERSVSRGKERSISRGKERPASRGIDRAPSRGRVRPPHGA